MTNFNVGNIHFALAITDYMMSDWERKDAETNRLHNAKINARALEQKAGIKAWAKKIFADSKKSKCNESPKCIECEVCA